MSKYDKTREAVANLPCLSASVNKEKKQVSNARLEELASFSASFSLLSFLHASLSYTNLLPSLPPSLSFPFFLHLFPISN